MSDDENTRSNSATASVITIAVKELRAVEVQPAAAKVYRGFIGKETGGTGNWSPIDLCTHDLHYPEKRICRKAR